MEFYIGRIIIEYLKQPRADGWDPRVRAAVAAFPLTLQDVEELDTVEGDKRFDIVQKLLEGGAMGFREHACCREMGGPVLAKDARCMKA